MSADTSTVRCVVIVSRELLGDSLLQCTSDLYDCHRRTRPGERACLRYFYLCEKGSAKLRDLLAACGDACAVHTHADGEPFEVEVVSSYMCQ